MRRRKKKPLCPWFSARQDNIETRFIQIGDTFMLSKAVQDLTGQTKWFYLSLGMEAAGKPTVRLSHSAAKKKYGIKKSTYDRAIKELVAAGFIEQILDEDRSQFRTNEFRFCDKWKCTNSSDDDKTAY